MYKYEVICICEDNQAKVVLRLPVNLKKRGTEVNEAWVPVGNH